MKKVLIGYLLIVIVALNIYSFAEQNKVQAEESQVIPKEAIRLRILANSDQAADQALKRYVRDEVNKNINAWVKDATSIKEGRRIIKEHLPEMKALVAEIVGEDGFTIEFKKNVSFPTKMYGEYVYPAGKYEALLITIGEGKGANWWCVLFPPLCFLDFTNGDAVSTADQKEKTVKTKRKKEVEVRSFFKDTAKKMIKK